MEIFIGEHGESLRSAVIGSFVLIILFTSISLISGIMPQYNTQACENSMKIHNKIKSNSPRILCDDVIYADYKKSINLSDYVKAKDAGGEDITGGIIYKGSINTNQKGLYIIYAKITNSKGYSDEKRIQVLVE